MYCRNTFSSNHNIHKSSCGLCFQAINPLINSLQPKNKGRTNFCVRCDLTKKNISNVLLSLYYFCVPKPSLQLRLQVALDIDETRPVRIMERSIFSERFCFLENQFGKCQVKYILIA